MAERLLSVPFAELNYGAIMAFLKRTSGWAPSHPEVGWRAIHKARTAMTGLPMVERTLSKRWLIAHGSEPYDDGDVPT